MPILFALLLITSFLSFAQNKCLNHQIETTDEEKKSIAEFCEDSGYEESRTSENLPSSPNRNGEGNAENPSSSCEIAKNNAKRCCHDSTASSCLTGEGRKKFQEYQTHPLMQVGASLGAQALAFVGMSEMCAGLDALMGLGNAVALSMGQNCESKINSCLSRCEEKVKQLCGLYKNCLTKNITHGTPSSINCAACDGIYGQLQKAEDRRLDCDRLVGRPAQFVNTAHQLHNTGQTAERCRLMASGKEENEDSNPPCIGPNCPPSPGECTDPNGCEDLDDLDSTPPPLPRATPPPGGKFVDLDPPNIQPPKKKTTPTGGDNTHSGSGGRGTTTTRGKGSHTQVGIPGASHSSGLSDEGRDSNLSPAFRGSGNFSKGLSSSGFGRGGKDTGAGKAEDEELKLSEGGFKGYNSGGKRRTPSSSLKLSQKQMKELEKKQGPKRKLPGLGEKEGGAHENIFERISRRYQISCKKKRLICD